MLEMAPEPSTLLSVITKDANLSLIYSVFAGIGWRNCLVEKGRRHVQTKRRREEKGN